MPESAEVITPDVPGDGIVDVPVLVEGAIVMPASDQFVAIMEQSWADHMGAVRQANLDMAAGHRFVTEQTRLGFVGQREQYAAKAAQDLNVNPIARNILDERSVRDQPGKV